MNLTDTETLKFLKGSPVLLDDICAVYSVKLGEIVDLGYDKFEQYLGVLTLTKPLTFPGADKEAESILQEMTDFQYFLMMATTDIQINNLVKNSFQFFTHENIMISLEPHSIIVGPAEEQRVMNEKSFYDFQRLMKRAYFLEQEGDEIIINEDDEPRVKQLKMKMRENREKVRRAKAAKAAREKSDMKLSDLIGSMTINDCGLNISNIWDITYYAFHDQLKRMGWRDQFNINQKAALAGAKINKSQLKHWMRSIASPDK